VKRLNPEISLGFLVASLFWIGVVGWQSSHAPAEKQNAECYEAAKKTGYKNEECKTFWERTTNDPIALFNLILAFSTVGLWIATISLYRAGEKQLGLARDEFDATHRPWIPITNVKINFGLKWAKGNAIVGLSVFCKNIGPSPAQRVSLNARIFPFLYNEAIPEEIAKLQASHAPSAATQQLTEQTLFPDAAQELATALVIPEAVIADLKDRFGDPATEMVPVIIGFIEYHFSFGVRSPHYTPFVYHLWRTDASGNARITFKLDASNVEADEMILVPLINVGDPT
jgi:hypothetical protein